MRSRCTRATSSWTIGRICTLITPSFGTFAKPDPRERSPRARPVLAAATGGGGRHGDEEADDGGEAQHQEGAEGRDQAAHHREPAEVDPPRPGPPGASPPRPRRPP